MKHNVHGQIYPEYPLKAAFRKSLRAKLLAGYAAFVLALVGFGAWSAWRMHEMGGISNRIIKDNYDSVVAAQNMKDSIERMDSASLLVLLGARQQIAPQIEEHRNRFDRAFDVARGNITEPDEPRILDDIRRERDAYYAALDDLLAGPEKSSGQDRYTETLEPAFNRLKNSADELLRINQEAMLAKSDAAAAVAGRWFTQILIIAGLLAIAGAGFAFWLAGKIVRPLHKISAAAAQIAKGDLSARVSLRLEDEIGLLASEFNHMADQLRHLHRMDDNLP
jgi:NtrC-family two-component system sensor histidine kinase KinB